MKFYIIETKEGETIGCELKKRDAVEFAQARGYAREEVEVYAVDCDVSAETIRRLLGNLGGYANS